MDIYLERFCKYDGPREFFPEFRELLCALSLRTFCGDYITEDKLLLLPIITTELPLLWSWSISIIIPYTKTWYGKKIADDTMKILRIVLLWLKHINENNGTLNVLWMNGFI